MKRAIFLLAFCAFQTVFAGLMEDLQNLRHESLKKMDKIIKKLELDLVAALEDAKHRGVNSKNVMSCWVEISNLEAYHQSGYSTYDDCYTRPATVDMGDEAFQFAEECYEEYINALVKEEQKCRSNAKECIQRHFIERFGPGRGAREHVLL